MAERCVVGNNIILHHDKSVSECAALCNGHNDCVAFEYGVNYGGTIGNYSPRDCQLQNSADYEGCNGEDYNLDLYIKSGKFINLLKSGELYQECHGEDYKFINIEDRI